MIQRGQAFITPQLLCEIFQEAFHLLHAALAVLRTYREELAKAATERDTESLERARLSLLKLGDVILPETYVQDKLKDAQQLVKTVGNLRAIKEAALSSTEINKLLLGKLEEEGIDPDLALNSLSKVRQRHRQEQDLTALLALLMQEVQQTV